jgi:MFS family permease
VTLALRQVFASLAVRNYRLFAIGQLVSLIGTWLQLTAQDWLVLDLTHNSATALGAITALQFTPMLLFTLYGGVLADRVDKRKLLLSVQSTLMVLAASLGLLVLAGTVQLWHVYVFAVLVGSANAFDMPARQSFVSELVGRERLPNAVALNSAVFNTARIVGPAAGGLLIALTGTGPAFLFNALSFVAVLTGLALMRPAELRRAPPGPRRPGQLREGIRYVRSRPDLLMVIALVSVVGTLGMNFMITLPLLARAEFGVGAASFGVLSAALGVGALIGALFGTRRTTRPSGAVVLRWAALFGLLETALAFAPSLLFAAVLLVPTGAFLIGHNTAANARVQLGATPALRGRVMSLYMLVFLGGTPLGSLAIGWISAAYGPRVGLAAGGVPALLAAGVLALARRHRHGLRTIPRVSVRGRLLPLSRHVDAPTLGIRAARRCAAPNGGVRVDRLDARAGVLVDQSPALARRPVLRPAPSSAALGRGRSRHRTADPAPGRRPAPAARPAGPSS